ncbi:TPA: hypothetical protein DDY56_01975 [Candidatus Uhrbacteria bacterium]|nr:MAG: hypothetical protein A2258_00665 [Candidatus Uhrbacteria bacterium RIFOXYA2_FULL_41_8]OGL96338.1 MAG: hypothetical protein A2317_00630 [Candidatus Uhrbacteria bacterium RIFOXYB2_FULL_41_10]HAL50165.1 hypothetical protein [Candidatus Uhrbacteria bacterium]HAN06302.1 hypothetical protein [Candidatus Uhrbacteria bacterium]HAP65465.1 hypothetical protein [Candidatus Uhrbacteria bacterium]
MAVDLIGGDVHHPDVFASLADDSAFVLAVAGDHQVRDGVAHDLAHVNIARKDGERLGEVEDDPHDDA